MAKIHGNGGELRETLDRATGKVEDAMSEMKDTIEALGGRLGGLVREHPMTSILAGVGLGFLVARLLSR